MRTTLIQRVLFSAAALVSAYSAHAVTIDEAINNMSPQVTSEAQVIDPRYDWQQHPSIIIGARNEEQLRQNLDAVGWNLTAEQVAKLGAASNPVVPYPYWHQRQFAERNPPPV